MPKTVVDGGNRVLESGGGGVSGIWWNTNIFLSGGPWGEEFLGVGGYQQHNNIVWVGVKKFS